MEKKEKLGQEEEVLEAMELEDGDLENVDGGVEGDVAVPNTGCVNILCKVTETD